ncbi:MAG: T9SS type A sorting domain-containing protein, partial [Cyclobacteriaceae bacterium]
SNFLYLGAISNPGGGGVAGFLDGDIAEAIVFGRGVNDAERIIVDNYLSAKYNLPLAGNDVYTMDDAGDYDFEVAGIGQAADGSNHRDARGTGLVRMWNPNNLGNSEFLIWGHDNTAITTTTTASPADVDGTVIEERLSRIWRVSETGDVGNVSISFDFSGVGGSPLGSNLRLLIDRDGDGFGDNDVTPITGTVSNGIAVFSNVNFVTGDRFTLGNTDASTPLPIELIEFTAKPFNANVLLTWETASELDNDYFTVERSGDAESWESVITIQGAGTTDISNSYEAVDYQPLAGLSYYRLKQTDFDGTVGYSGIEVVKLNPENQLVVSPNPSRGSFVISGSQDLNASQIRVFNSLGQMIKPGIHKDNELSVDLHGFPQGVYVLQVTDGLSVKSIRLMKN